MLLRLFLMSSAANNVIQFPVSQDNTEFIMDADYFGYSETIPIIELLRVLRESNTSNTG